ncbi:MAG: fibrobacter succinogenes major paralogous domain-containing protein [Bacteroidota bacterium]
MNTIKTLTRCIFLASSLIISSCSGGVKDQDGNSYKTVKIGNQRWMVENLSVSHFRNGDTIPEVRSSEEWKRLGEEGKPAWCTIQNDPENGKKYGKLYNWCAVTDPRGLAPKGWHVPSDEEWTQLTNYLGGGVSAALIMRKVGFAEKGKEADQGSFSALPGGNRISNGTFYGLDTYGYWWSATEVNASNAWMRLLNYVKCDVNILIYNKINGLSVRCIRE